MNTKDKPIVFFDGHCNMCNGFVDFLFRNDKKNTYLVASIQGETAKEFLSPAEIETCSSLILVFNQIKYRKSKGVLKIMGDLSFPWNILGLFQIIPAFISDFFYDIIAKHRYRILGRRDTCRMPTEAEKEKMLP